MSYKKRVIDVEKWAKWYKKLTHDLKPYDHYDMGYGDAVDCIDDWMDTQPMIDVDAAQLEKLGIGFGQKCVCEHCRFKRMSSSNLWCDIFDNIMPEDGYCCFFEFDNVKQEG